MTYEKSCGAVLFTRRGKSIRYVIVHQRRGSWGFPKGHVEAGESERETALREIYEEVGIRPRLIDGFREESRYMLPRSTIRKTVVLFLAEYENQKIHPQKEELLEAPLLSYEEALKKLPHEDTRRILTAAHLFIQGYFDKDEDEEERPPRHFDRNRRPAPHRRPPAKDGAAKKAEEGKDGRTAETAPAKGEGAPQTDAAKKPRRPYIPWYKRKKKKKNGASSEGAGTSNAPKM